MTLPKIQSRLVLWQHPRTHEHYPVGLLVYDGEQYQFNYVADVEDIRGFLLFEGLQNPHKTYLGESPPEVFRKWACPQVLPGIESTLIPLHLDDLPVMDWKDLNQSQPCAGDEVKFMKMPDQHSWQE